jgi:hypothetical protein
MIIKNKTIDIKITIPEEESVATVMQHPQDFIKTFIPSEVDDEIKEVIFRSKNEGKEVKTGPYVPPKVGRDLKEEPDIDEFPQQRGER